jgi:hypothetical protein
MEIRQQPPRHTVAFSVAHPTGRTRVSGHRSSGALPDSELRRCPGQETLTDGTLARAAACDVEINPLQAPRVLPRRGAYEHLLRDPAIEGSFATIV